MADMLDDSAPITAFDSAIAKYKEMHSPSGKQRTMAEKSNAISESDYNVISESESLEADADLQKIQGVPLKSMVEEPEKNLAFEAAFGGVQTENLTDEGYTCEYEWPEQAYKGYPAVEHEQERQQIMSELQCMTEQQHRLLERLTQLRNLGSGGVTCPTSQPHTYSMHGASTTLDSYYPYQLGTYDNSSSSCALQCQDCGYISNGNNCQGNSIKYCDTPQNTSQKLPDASALPQIVRTAVAEAMKEAEAQNFTVGIDCKKHSGLSDVVIAWFLAGFHTSRLLLHGGGASQ